jgi:putative membrane protein
MSNGDDKKTNISSEEFKLRMQIETMLLTWLRTALAFMGFGFVTARFGIFLKQIATASQAHVVDHPHLAQANTITGAFMILLGVAILVISIISHFRTIARLERGEMASSGSWSLGVILSMILAAVGTGMAIYLTILEL